MGIQETQACPEVQGFKRGTQKAVKNVFTSITQKMLTPHLKNNILGQVREEAE